MEASDVTELLREWAAGDEQALERLIPLVYADLRRVADGYLRREGAAQTLQPTALVHELYLKLANQDRMEWRNREQFFATAAFLMRRLLVDRARRRLAGKRGGGASLVPIDEAVDRAAEPNRALLAVDAALTRFAELDPERARVVELRYFGGLDMEEIAEVLQVSRTTVKRHWTVARMWLHKEIQGN
jgi:RNA polymerase sigma factor (TIGR02999 family)